MAIVKRVHMVGIGGSGMSGIAEILWNIGFKVTGSDIQEGVNVKHLKRLGIPITIGHRAENVEEAQLVIISSAIKKDNIEVKRAKELRIPVISRADALAQLVRMKYSIAVAGTHGKTTTTSMIGIILKEAGLDPTIIVGGIPQQLGSTAKMGKGEFLVAEADESDGSFLKLYPFAEVITNIE
ncbi:MAG TPA: UDP-N-acetylmuramate--L-alanine ligase, partial [candidate division WOR-3 bacterium]|nr:UDP-N-acetylmuramate--L-alanine ligase [candidate division WOR-3 bacterium]